VRTRARTWRFDEARSLLAGYLRAHPGDRRAHLLMAQLATEPPDPVPELAASYKGTYLQLRGSSLEMDSAAAKTEVRKAGLGDRRGVYDEAIMMPTLGLQPHPELYRRLADLRERMGRTDEARAWHRRVLRDNPCDPVSLAALERLK
jgi:hypothetical protein